MNPNLDLLHPYPFSKMATLLADSSPAKDYQPIKLGIGEPKHQPPQFVLDELIKHASKVQNYPTTGGMPELSETIANWLTKRFSLKQINPATEVIPVMGTREAIFSFVQACINKNPATSANTTSAINNTPDFSAQQPIVVMPNPFYQIYEGASILAEAEPFYVPCTPENGYKADYRQVPDEVWQQTQLVFACSPNNPTGSVIPVEDWQYLLEMSDKYDFIIASDECYSELYFDAPPVGLLEVCASLGRDDYHNCVVFHSLSKRSNLPGLRSGFIAGDSKLLTPYLQYRTYQGCAMPIHHQYASIQAWQDETHVEENRKLYREKFDLWMNEFDGLLDIRKPDAGFYFWLKVPERFAGEQIDGDDEQFVKLLFERLNIHALAGRYLSRDISCDTSYDTSHDIDEQNEDKQNKGEQNKNNNPGKGYVRLALVASVSESQEAIERIKGLL